MNKFTAQAPTVEEAIDIALEALKAKREETEITVEDEGRKGFLGLGQKNAVVTVSLIQSSDTSTFKDVDFMADLEEDTVAEEAPSPQIPASPSVDSGQAPDVAEEDEDSFVESELTDSQAIEAVSDYIKTIAYQLGIEEIDVDVYQELDNVYFDLSTDKPGIIIGRHGKVLDAIHTLAQIYLHNHAPSKLNARLDSENYRGRKEESLKSLAERSAEKVVQTKQVEILESLAAKERKLIHRILSDHPDVKTHSEGEEPDRYLVIEPTDI